MSFYPTHSTPSNWVVVLISSGIIISVGMGIRQSFGLFLLPVSDVLGEGRTLFSLAIALQNLTWGIAAPVFGAMADKYGPARVCLAGGLLGSKQTIQAVLSLTSKPTRKKAFGGSK